jgi:hypothetical protein
VKRTASVSALISTALALGLLFAVSSRAWAIDTITSPDLEAAAHAIGFLNGLPTDGTLVVGIVYADSPDGKAKAVQAAERLAGIQGPRKAKFRTILIAAKDLASATGRLDAVILMPNQTISATDLSNAVRRRRVVSISMEPNCIEEKCCVLQIRTAGRVRIVLDTFLAEAVGAQFSSIFMMMVERK